jgi:uncharacterized RmlC-like cupin family protein
MKIRPLTEEEQAHWPKEPLVALDKSFADARGAIQPLADLTMESASLITSAPDTVRANHYHQTDWHYCYLLSGSMDYYHRPHGSSDEPERVRVNAGDMVFTPPLVDHAMKFLEETTFLTLSRNPRDQESYEADVVRIKLID